MLFLFFYLTGVATISVSLTFLIVGNCLTEDDDYVEDDVDDDDEYENKYYDELNKLEYFALDKESLYKLRYKSVCEKTLNGDVIMTYNSDTGTFWYYCDNKDSVKFTTLDAVARKFTVENNCKCICVNSMEESDKSYHQADYYAVLKQMKSNHVKKHGSGGSGLSNVKSVYARFKTYNGNKNNDGGTTSSSSYQTKKHITNRFSYKGKLNEYKSFKEQDKELSEKKRMSSIGKHIDFAEFKKMHQLSTSAAASTSSDLSSSTLHCSSSTLSHQSSTLTCSSILHDEEKEEKKLIDEVKVDEEKKGGCGGNDDDDEKSKSCVETQHEKQDESFELIK